MAAIDERCCAMNYTVLWDHAEEPIAAVIDNFLCDPGGCVCCDCAQWRKWLSAALRC